MKLLKIGDVLKIDLSNYIDKHSSVSGMIVAVIITSVKETSYEGKDCLGYSYKPFNKDSTGYIIDINNYERTISSIDLSKLKNANPETIYKMLEHTDDDSFWLAQQILKNEGLL